MKGWIQLHRKILKSPMYRMLNSKQRDVMMTVLLLANHESNTWEFRGEIYSVKPGQFITSLDSLKEHCASDVSIQNIRTALLKLEKHGFLTNESTKKNRLITVVNWGLYQSTDDDANKEINRQPTKSQQTTNNNDNNDNNDKNEIKDIFDFWNSLEIVKHRELTQKMKSSISARLKNISVEEMKEAINNYNSIISSDLYWYTYKFTLDKFMNPKNIDQFLTENKPFEKFIKNQGGGGYGGSSGLPKHERDSKKGYGGSDRKITSLDQTTNVREFTDDELATLF
ncbi:hypothetical protein [Staphylococcus warneri]|uniref:hypothetical protein n=1 Tax=Staphylococcus warneri TaxID=1292 RepID=UPI003BA1D598